jgi:hypothetical protein
MAVRHTAWRIDLSRARPAFEQLAGSADLLGAAVTAAVDRVRSDPTRRDHLVMLRLDPTDDEAWTAVLEPGPDDAGYEVAAAARLMLLLVGACTEAAGIRSPPSYLASHLGASGWSRDRVELAIHGARISTFLTQVAPELSGVVAQSRSWLTGGWLDAPTAAGLRSDLQRDLPTLLSRIPETAAQQSSQSGLEQTWHAEVLRAGLGDLEAMLGQLAGDKALWIIED